MNTTTWKNRLLSAALTVIMVFSMVPLSVFAADGAVAEVTVGTTTTQYTDIDAAFTAAQEADSATVKLLADVTISHTNDTYGIELEKGNITLDLNGKTISQKSEIAKNKFYSLSAVFYLALPQVSSAEEFSASLQATTRLTVQDSVGGGKIVQPNGGPAIIVTFNTILTVNGGTIETTSSDDFDDKRLHMTPNCAVLLSDGGKAVINGGTLRGIRGVAVMGYITKEEENLYKEYLGIDGYNNETYGNELTVTGGEISGTDGEALIVYEKAKKIVLSGGTFTTQSNEYSIWAADTEEDGEPTIKGDAASLLASGYRFENNGTECAYSEDGKGVKGNATVAPRPANEYAYIGKDGKLTTQTNCTEITAATDDIAHGWHVLKEDITISSLNISGEVNLILCDGATLTIRDFMNVTDGCTLNLYWQSAGSGKLTAASISGKGSVAAPAGEMKQTTDEDGTTYEKCLTHEWQYTANEGDTHTATCTLCGKDGGAVAHEFNKLESTTESTHTYSCACGAESTEDHILTCTPNADGLTHSAKCSKCGYAATAENHDFSDTDQWGKQCACGEYLTATYNNRNYATLASAVEAARSGGTVTLEKDVGENIIITDGMTVTIDLNNKTWTHTNENGNQPALTVNGGSVTVKNGTILTGGMSGAYHPVEINGGHLTVGARMTIQSSDSGAVSNPAIKMTDGKLTLSVDTKLVCGMRVPEGKQLKDYLPEDTAFQQTDYDQGSATGTAKIIDGYVQEYVGKFTLNVVEHKTHSYTDGVCDCGYVCEHTGGTASYFQKKVCTICGAEYGDLLTDTTAPTGSITVKERTPFQTFIKTITFGLFFKEDVTATVTATDDSYKQAGYDKSKHAVKIKYLVSDQALAEEDLKAQTFTDYIKAIDLTDEQNYVVYARLTDHAGNETYLSTDGFVIDKTAPSINDFADGQEVHICSSSYTVSVQDKNLKEVTVDGVKQTGNSITFYMAESGNIHTVVAEDRAGNTSTVKFTLHGGHNYNIETGVCENNCGAAAEVRVTDDTGTHVWEQFGEALRILYKSTTPVTVTLLRDCRYADYTQIVRNELTVDLNGHSFGNASDRFCVVQPDAENKCKLTITGEGRFEPSILLASGSTLTVDENVTYVGGIKSYFHTYFGDKVTDLSVTLRGGKYGVIDLTYEDNDGDTQTAGTLSDLTAPGYVFTDSTAADSSSAANVEVVPCTNHIWNNGVCSTCKLPCTHNWNGNKCTVCGYVCSHSSVEERGDDTYCTTCEQQMAAKVEKDDSTTYYAKHFEDNEYHAEDTLKGVFNEAPNDSTVTLLADGLYAFAWAEGKTIKLNLNGKKLIENNGIVVDIDSDTNTGGKLFVCGEGSSRAPEESVFPCTFRVWDGGTLVFGDDFGGTFGTIYVHGGTLIFNSPNAEIGTLVVQNAAITLKGGKFGTICGNIGITVQAGSLLERGYAFQKADGSYVPYDTEISEVKALENVTVVKCDHRMTELPTGNQYNRLKCPNCNEGLEAVLKTADGKINGYKDLTDSFGRTGALSVAEATPGCTVTMYYNAEWLSIRSTAEGFTLDANGCSFAQLELHEGTLTVKNATITGSEHNGGFTVKTYSDVFGTSSSKLTLENCKVHEPEGADATTLRVSGSLTLKNTTVYGKTSVFSDADERLTVDGSDLYGDVTVRANLTFKSGYAEKITVYGAAEISDGTIDELDCSDAASLTVSGGQFGKITAPDGKQLIDCLKDGYAFYNSDNSALVDGRAGTLVGVYVAEHTHGDYKWDTATHEKVCACGDVKETDTAAPTFDGVVTGETYYQNILTFAAEDDGSGIKEVKDGDKVLTADADGNYTIHADNKEHTVTATDNAGNTTTVTVTVYKVYNVTLVGGEGYTVTASSQTVGHGQDYDFRVDIKPGYSKTSNYKIIVNDVADDAKLASLGDTDYDSCTYFGAEGDLTVTVQGVGDITAPEAEMTIGTNKFKSFLNRITFGLFFKQTQTVTVAVSDAGSGVKSVEYLLSEMPFEQIGDIEGLCTEIDIKDGKATFTVEPTQKAFIYVRVTDNAGNYTVINSEGVVLYTDSDAVTESIEFTRLSTTDVNITVDLKGNTVKSVYCDGNELNGTSYNVLYPSADSGSTHGTIVLKNMFLSNLATGEYTITVEYNPMGETYKEAEGNEAPDFTEVKLTVVKAKRTLTFDAPNAIYDGEVYDDLSITDQPDGTTIQYKKQDADDRTYDTAAPKNAGSYTVKITVAEDENYNAKTFTEDFTIYPKEVAIVGVKAADKTYDGTTVATIANTGILSGICGGDDLTIDAGNAEAAFESKNVGSRIVTFKGFVLSGSAKDNYDLIDQPASVTADINRKALTVGNLKVKDKLYDGTNKAKIDGTPTLEGLVDGDKLTLVNGTPTFDSIDAGTNIPVSFTYFNLLGDEVTLQNYSLPATPTGITADIIEWVATGDEFTTTQDWSYRDFTVTAKTGYQLSLTDTADGSWTDTLTAPKQPTGVYGFTFYVKDTDTGAISTAVTREYKIDRTCPEGTVTLTFGGRSFTSDNFIFPYGITFDTFSNEDVTVTVTGTDIGSGVKSVSYYKSDKALTDTQVVGITDWTEIDGNHFTIKAEDMTKFVLYVFIKDNTGNVQYLTANGVVFDTTVPEILGTDDGKTYYVTQRIFADDDNIASVTLNGVAQDADSFFELTGDTDAVYTIVATDKAGNVTEYTVTMQPISAITDAIKDITEENVTSADADTIDQVAQQILDIAAESDEDVIGAEQWNKLVAAAENCKRLETRIAEISAEINSLTDEVSCYDIDKVTSSDKSDIEQLITDIDVLLAADNLTDDERASLETLRATAQELLGRIVDAKSAAEADETVAVRDVTKDNVTLDDKAALENAEKALEKALDDFDGNYTDDERKTLETALDTVKEALTAIDRAEKTADEIEKLPSADDVKLTDKDEIDRLQKAVGALTENEKAMLGNKPIEKLKALTDRLSSLAGETEKSHTPKTGDTVALWIAALFISGGVITGVTVAGKKKKQQD